MTVHALYEPEGNVVRIVTPGTGLKTGTIAPRESGRTYQPSEGEWQTEATPAVGSIVILLQSPSEARPAALGGLCRVA